MNTSNNNGGIVFATVLVQCFVVVLLAKSHFVLNPIKCGFAYKIIYRVVSIVGCFPAETESENRKL